MNQVTASRDEAQGRNASARTDAALLPPVDVIEDATGITLYADLTGLSKDKLNMQIESDTLTIKAN